MTSKFSIDNRELLQRISSGEAVAGIDFGNLIVRELAAFRLAAMDQKPALHRYRRKAVEPYGPYPWHYEVFVDYPRPVECIEDEYFYAAPPVVTGFAVDGESECLPLDYLQGHKDGLEWAAQLAEANHPETGDWLYDDPIELAKAIRKGPDMPPVQPVADSEPVAYIFKHPAGRLFWSLTDKSNKGHDDVMPVYASPQPAQVVPDEVTAEDCPAFVEYEVAEVDEAWSRGFNACRSAMLADATHDTPDLNSVQSVVTVPGKWIPVSERMPDDDDFVYIWPRPDFGVELHVGQYCERSHKGGGWYAQVYEQNYGIEWHPITVTHWMPLPAAPQEVK
ncbi:DUF551 domain-containing protein [Klebsiella pneumoniae]|uniref:DUF551 domain-containing protein n=1 Tax=Klebsiella pneumoniae TaxID=573 RepID=UPI001D0D8D42|nr:DUF551 domain-containing protein [Klebsiella pneumoniae]